MEKLYENPPPEIPRGHWAHRAHKLELVTSNAPFNCDGCKEPGRGPRYTCGGGDSFNLHTCCALAERTLVHHLLPKRVVFEFLKEPTPPVEGTFCDACGEPARGFVYHCSDKDLDLHPCCASLKEKIRVDGHTFELRREASQRCRECGKKGRRNNFWAYRTNLDGQAVDVHVACMKDLAEAAYPNKSDGQASKANIIIERILQSLPGNIRSGFDQQFKRVLVNVACVVVAVIFGDPRAMIEAVAGPSGA